MSFIHPTDYVATLEPNRKPFTASDDAFAQAERRVETTMYDALKQRYNMDKAFYPLLSYSDTRTYKWADRLYLTATAYANATTYTNGVQMLYNGIVYQKNSETSGYTSGTLPTNATYFDVLGFEGHWYVTEPSQYSRSVTYAIGDKVTYRGNYYQAISICKDAQPDALLCWEPIEREAIAVGTKPNGSALWTNADSRNATLVGNYVDMVIFLVEQRNNPRMIPQHRTDAYNRAVDWLNDCTVGKRNIELGDIYPEATNAPTITSGTYKNFRY